MATYFGCYFSPFSIERLRKYLNKFIERKGIIECTLQRVMRGQKDFAGVVELKTDHCTGGELLFIIFLRMPHTMPRAQKPDNGE
jgi:hypothetical protein